MYVADARFESTSRGRRFVIEHRPEPSSRQSGTVVFLPPFAEEMNKSRRMVAETCRHLAAAGWRSIVFDLHGCGDSSGDFADACWSDWTTDAAEISAEALRGEPRGSMWIWALRAGALLVPAALEGAPGAAVLLWQPVISGRQHLTQFLRLRAAQSALGGETRITVNEIRQQIDSGATVEVAGYSMTRRLAAGFDSARLDLGEATVSAVEWLEVSASSPPALSPTTTGVCERWRASGTPVRATAVAGLPFWQTQEIAECPALIDATLCALAQHR